MARKRVAVATSTLPTAHNASPVEASIATRAPKKARIRELREVEEAVGAAIVERESEQLGQRGRKRH